jgi:hypothetical protein
LGNCPFKEQGIFIGLAFTGNSKRQEYTNIIDKIYTKTFFYSIHEGRCYNWTNDQHLLNVLSKEDNTYIYSMLNGGAIPP